MRAEITIDPRHVLWSAAAEERAGRPLIVLMHGWSDDETHLFALAGRFPRDMVVASVRAPHAEGGGYAWFPKRGSRSGYPQPAVVEEAAQAMLDWLDTLPPAPSTGLLGFSQGGAMVLQLMRRAPRRFAYGVQLAGFVAGGHQAGDEILARSRPPVFWGRGRRDSTIPRQAIARTRAWMSAHTTPHTVVYDGLGHGISEREAADVAAFVARQASGHRQWTMTA
jgi:phospholipase/carboxylesterase